MNNKKFDITDIENYEGKSSILTGKDILPKLYSERTISPRTLTIIWVGMAIEITILMSAALLYASMPVWEIMLASLVGHLILFITLVFTADMGVKYGIPFAVSLRPSFGYIGAIVIPYFRAIPAMFWFGFQTWVAASAVNQIINLIWGYENLILWIVVLGIVQIIHTSFGIGAVAKLSTFALPMLVAVAIYMIYIAFADFDLSWSTIWTMKGSDTSEYTFMYATLSFTGGWATLAMSIMDITRDCKITKEEACSFATVNKKYVPSQLIGILPAVLFYTFVGILGVITTGEIDPAQMLVAMNSGRSDFALFICLVFILIATWCTNSTANLFPAGYTISNTIPSKINFAKGIIIAGLIGLAIRPWTLSNDIIDIMVIIGNFLAPVAGIMISDYFFLRKRNIKVRDLYNINGQYKYWNNINPAAFISLPLTIVVTWNAGNMQYFLSLLISGIVYLILMKFWIVKKYPQEEVTVK